MTFAISIILRLTTCGIKQFNIKMYVTRHGSNSMKYSYDYHWNGGLWNFLCSEHFLFTSISNYYISRKLSIYTNSNFYYKLEQNIMSGERTILVAPSHQCYPFYNSLMMQWKHTNVESVAMGKKNVLPWRNGSSIFIKSRF